MDPDAAFTRIAALRIEFADFVDTLDERQLATQSLCGEWDVKTVAGHLNVLATTSMPTFALAMLRGRGNFDRANTALARRSAGRGIPAVTATMRARATSRATPPGAGPLAPMTDLLVHNADIKLPLGLAFTPAPEDVLAGLGFVAKSPRGFVAKGRLDGIRIAPTDADRSWGEGADLTGTSADLLLALCGRPTLDRLDGPGRDVLAARV